MVKYIVVTGGVISGVGKGVTTASIGKILKEYGYNVTAVKVDPYFNYDAGTLRPTEHGEVWVTDDGGEIDQDLGNYERFLNIDIPKKNCLTSGQIYKEVIDKERRGDYLGKTVQFIPHVTDEVKKRIRGAANSYDFVLVEVGGTVGDFESVPFLFGMKGLEREKEDIAYMLVTYLPTPSHIEEMKTKPTQQAIKALNEHGIFPHFIICRANKALDSVRKKKIETFANIPSDDIISEPDIDTVYRIPLDLEKERLGHKILEHFRMRPKKRPSWKKWKQLVERMVSPRKTLNVAIVGKYVNIGQYSLSDSYISINHALMHAGAAFNAGIKIEWLDAKRFERNSNRLKELSKYDGIIVPGGFGSSGVEGKIHVAGYARRNNMPYLGLCYGMQLAIVEFARNVCNLKDANTTEVNKKTRNPVIDILPSQKALLEKSQYGGTMRLGAYSAVMKDSSRALKLYRETGRLQEDTKRLALLKKQKEHRFRLGVLNKSRNVVLERHRHRYEMNPKFVDILEKHGMVFSGYHVRQDDKARLMEFIELPKHKFFMGTQAHPEFKSRLGNPHPLFYGFVKAMMK